MSQGSSPKSFGRLLADYASNPINLCSVSVTSLAALVNVYRVRKHYALLDVIRDGVDTVGVWGSNPHAPTNPLNNLARTNSRSPLLPHAADVVNSSPTV
jgi:hypothetical protein